MANNLLNKKTGGALKLSNFDDNFPIFVDIQWSAASC